MLPLNPQSLTATEKAVLESLKQQAEQINSQNTVLQNLVDKVTRQMRFDERIEKNNRKNKNEIGKDTRVKDIPGIMFDKFSDKLNDSISKSFSSIRDAFKEDKAKPTNKSNTTDKPKKIFSQNKDKEPKDEKDVLKSILNSMVSSSKYQEQLLEHTKEIQSIASKTFVSINDLKNNIQNTEQAENSVPQDEKDVAKTKDKEKNTKSLKVKTEKLTPSLNASNDNVFTDKDKITPSETKLPESIGTSVAKHLKPQFDVLGKTFKNSIEDGINQLDDSISNLNGIGSSSIIPSPDINNKNPSSTKGSVAKPVAAGTAIAAGGASQIIKKPSLSKIAKGAGILGGGYLLGDALFGTSDEDLATLRSAEEKRKGTQAQVREIDNKIESAESERNIADKETGGRYTEGKLERRADKIKPEYLKWAQKFYNDPNLQDPDYLSLPQNKNILELLEERQKLGINVKSEETNINADKKENKISKRETKQSESSNIDMLDVDNTNSEATKIIPKRKQDANLMKEVTDEKTELNSSSKPTTPIIINNNTNNTVSDRGQSMSFVSASSKNNSTAINDYFRHNARLFDAVA